MNESTQNELRIAQLEGEIAILQRDLNTAMRNCECFIDQLWFWRRKYLNEHPEKDNWDYALSAYSDETGKPSAGDDIPPSAMHENNVP